MKKRNLYLDISSARSNLSFDKDMIELLFCINNFRKPRIAISEIGHIFFISDEPEFEQKISKSLNAPPSSPAFPAPSIYGPAYSFLKSLPPELKPGSVVRVLLSEPSCQGYFQYSLSNDRVITPKAASHKIPHFFKNWNQSSESAKNVFPKHYDFLKDIDALIRSLTMEIRGRNFFNSHTMNNKLYKISFLMLLRQIVSDSTDLATLRERVHALLHSKVDASVLSFLLISYSGMPKAFISPQKTYERVGSGLFSHRVKDLLLTYLETNKIEDLIDGNFKQPSDLSENQKIKM